MDHHDKKEVDRIVEAIIYLYSESRRVTKEVARRYGLTGPQVTCVKLLEALGDLSLSALSAEMSARNSTITGLVDRLERDQLVQRVRSERDRRVVLIQLTPQGRELAGQVPVASMEVFGRALERLSGTDRSALRGLLKKLTDLVRDEVALTEERLEEHPARDTAP